jgi:hypothetical protein
VVINEPTLVMEPEGTAAIDPKRVPELLITSLTPRIPNNPWAGLRRRHLTKS